jgi:peptidoglycan/xylan/chitin deacetylase (PgdA/CDA1 family)
MRLYRPGFPAFCLYPDAIFRVKTDDRFLYLTFDDGPDPVSTPLLLGILKKFNVNATFFCNGGKAEAHPELMSRIGSAGHIVGNHTYKHGDGWHTPTQEYIGDVLKASPLTSGTLFRPPYGHLKFRQYRTLKKNYKIIFWDIMPYDFDEEFGKERSLNVLKKKIRPGSIIVLHDKPTSTSLEFLDEFLNYATEIGYTFQDKIR